MEKRSFLNQSTVTYIALALIGAGAMVVSIDIPRDMDGSLGARVFPMMSSGALILLGTIGFLAGLKPVALRKEKAGNKLLAQIAVLLALSLFYVWIISKLGYLISTALVAPLILLLFGIRNPLGLVIAAVVCPAIYHGIFFMGLSVFPPYGEWFDLLYLFQK
jgi:hypothetical protein